MTAATTAIHQAASLLLAYPDTDWPERLQLIQDALRSVPGESGQLLTAFCREAAAVPALELQARYVTTFDRSRRRSLHLTYYTDGDTRRRGASLVRLRSLMRAHGWQPAEGELPDFLPALLEFAARCPEAGRQSLTGHHAALVLLHEALEKHHSPYAAVVRAVLLTLPAPSPADRRHARQLARTGPPAETVGLAPYSAREGGPR
ncbi:nitrate reductase molybdenum cofactor assembly chaperone [Streptomyces orinoci]|uniref:Nitrate reductase molybdenum cofactor assembly chaperone n=1 Tax=Streptomyces orinoci TaxID=67339 RepID=A0ABV3JZ19_STRON|nr:nitrate reductase molybdenum cofactor assembly chaperone [Streptomyces orinoci]